ncbi:MAG TPA: hypothetical protein VGQ41_24595 [Pyrinomonadaceae bacterium]|jgi:hypothetical protein|nr:hypothetical protein [Pyrinomonadaceae bacterium]
MNYEPAQIADLADAGVFICGLKYVIDTWDANTGEYGTMLLIWLEE